MTHTAEDGRIFPFFQVDNALIDKFGPVIGPYGIAVYCVIVRHVNQKSGVAFPSIKTIARESGMSIPRAQKSVNLLKAQGLIKVEATKRDDNGNSVNHYTIVNVEPLTPHLTSLNTPPFNENECPPCNDVESNKTNLSDKTKDSPEEKTPPAAPVEEPTPQPPTLPVDTAVKEAPKKPATPERWHELVGEIMTHFKEPGGFAAKLAAQLSGTSTDKARSQHNCNPPAKPEDIGPFVKHYRRHNQGASLPTSAENLERYWLKFVADTQPVQWVEPEPTPEEPLNPHDPYAFLKRKREERDRAREAAFLSAS